MQNPRFIPSNLTQSIENAFGVVHWGPLDNGRAQAMAFRGKAGRHSWHYAFKNEEAMRAEADKFLKNLEGSAKYRAELKGHRARHAAEALAKLQPGTLLYRTWGYEQTNCDFYQVVRLLSKTIEVRKIGHATTETGFMQGYATPCKDHFIGPVQRVGPDKYSVLDRPSVGVSWYA